MTLEPTASGLVWTMNLDDPIDTKLTPLNLMLPNGEPLTVAIKLAPVAFEDWLQALRDFDMVSYEWVQ